MTEKSNQNGARRNRRWCGTVDAIGWGLFFIWIGIAITADVGWGVGLIGIGVLILGSWAAREFIPGSGCSGTSGVRS